MKTRRQSVSGFEPPPVNDRPFCLRGVQDHLRRVPCVRSEKIADIRRWMESGEWPPGPDLIADRILVEHLLGPLQP